LLRARTTMRANLTEVLELVAQGMSATKPSIAEPQLLLLS